MPKDPDQDSTEDSITSDLTEIYNQITPLMTDADIFQYIYFLMLMWASFRVYQLEPPVDEIKREPNIIKMPNGRLIFDYGFYLSTSPGEDYGSYCTGKLIETAQEMMAILVNRGATKVAFAGHTIAQRAAWIECVKGDVESNFHPEPWDWNTCERILAMQKEAAKQVKKSLEENRPD